MSEGKQTVVTAVGSDAVGLVTGISEQISQSGANVEDSRMAVLGGEFALMMLVAGDGRALARMREGVERFAGDRAMDVRFRDAQGAASREGTRYRIEVSGLDHRGIVANIAGALTRTKTNIDAMETQVVPGAMSGTPTFVLNASVTAPPPLTADRLREAVQHVCDEENLDLVIEPLA